jgi:charged multivesicular body protein 1
MPLFGGDPVKKMQKQLFNLKFTAKSLSREATKCEKQEKENKKKCKKAMEKGNIEGARIYAENSIRLHNQSLNYMKLSSRIDAVAARVNTAVQMGKLTKDMSKIVGSMDSVMKSMDVEKISAVMDKFEQQFEDLDLTSQYMENAIDSTTSATMPESQVENLMAQIADENGLDFESKLDDIGVGKGQLKSAEKSKDNDELEERLKKLQGI